MKIEAAETVTVLYDMSIKVWNVSSARNIRPQCMVLLSKDTEDKQVFSLPVGYKWPLLGRGDHSSLYHIVFQSW